MSTEGESSSGSWLQSARTWSGVAFVFLAILGVAGLLFNEHSKRREAELLQQYARGANRVAHQIELRYQTYRQLLDNVNRLLASAQTVADNERREALQNALAQLKTKQARQKDAETQLTQANGLSTKIAKALTELEKKTKSAEASESAYLKEAAQYAGEWQRLLRALAKKEERTDILTATRDELANRLAQLGNGAAPLVNGRAGGSNLGPANNAGGAPGAGGASDRADTAGEATLNSAGGPNAGGQTNASGAVSSAGGAPATPEQIKDELEAALRSAQSALDQARDDADETLFLAMTARERAYDSYQATRTAADEKNQAKTEAVGKAAAQANASGDVLRSAQNLQAAAQAVYQAKDDAAAAQSQSAAVLAARFRDQLQKVVFQSYWTEIARCPYANLDELMLCAARTISRLSTAASKDAGASSESRLEFVGCPSTPTNSGDADLAALAADGSLILLPIGDAARLPSRICGQVRIEQLWPTLESADAPGGFRSVALTNHDGTTLHVSPADPAIVNVPGLAALKPTASTTMKNVQLGTELYRGFLNPIKLRLAGQAGCSKAEASCSPADTSSERADLILAGFVEENLLAKAKLEIDLPSYLWVVLLLCVGVLALPLAKLWLLGTFTSFRRFDVTLLATSGLITTLLTVVLLLSLVAHNRLWQRADDQSKAAASKLKQDLERHLQDAAKALTAFTTEGEVRKLHAALSANPEVEARSISDTCSGKANSALFEGDPNRWSVCEHAEFKLQGAAGVPWNVAFLTNTLGFQEAKFVPSAHASMTVGVAHRDYFRQVLDGRTSCYSRPCTSGEEIGAEIVRSVTSGEIVLVAARRVEEPSSGSEHRLIGVAALETPLSSFRGLTLPLGMKAVVVDRSGKVLMHSGDEAAYGQDFLADIDAATDLRAALVNEAPGTVELRYMGALSRVRVAPLGLRGLGWTVLTIAPSSLVDVATTDMVLISLFGMLGLVLLLALAGCVLVLVVRAAWLLGYGETFHLTSTRGLHLRPVLSQASAYGSVGVWMLRWSAALCLLSLLLVHFLPISLALAVNAVLAWIALSRVPGVGVHLPLAAPLSRLLGNTALSERRALPLALAYALCLLGLAGLFVVAPTAIVFSGAYNHVTDGLVRAEQYDLSSRLRHRSGCLDLSKNAAREAEDSCDNVVSGSEAEPPGSTLAQSTASCVGSPLLCLADYLPPIGCTAAQALGRLYRWEMPPPVAAEDKAGDFELRRAGAEMQLVSLREGRALRSERLPSLFSVHYNFIHLSALLLVFAGFLAGSSALVFRSLERLFFLDLPDRPAVARLDPRTLTAGSTTLLLFADEKVQKKLGDEIRAIGGALPPTRVAWFDPRELAPSKFEYVQAGLAVVLLCIDDPLRLAPAETRAQWAALLKNWTVVELKRTDADGVGPAASLAQLMALYDSCDEPERRVLAQLALGGYANPHPSNRETMRRLLCRGILSPRTLTIENSELVELIQGSVTVQQQREWEKADSGTDWQALRTPLSAAVVAIFSALTVSKPELGAASALVPTLAAGLPSVFKVLLQMAQKNG